MKMFLLLTFAASAGQLLAESAIPRPYDRERYDGTMTESPFALETPKVEDEKPVQQGNVLTDLYITGLTQFEGKDLVMVKSVSDSQGITLVGNEPYQAAEIVGQQNPMAKYNGVRVERVHWSDRWSGVKVDLAHGSNLHRPGVEFKRDQSAVAATRKRPPSPVWPAGAPTGNISGGGRQKNLTPGAPRPIGTQAIPSTVVPRPSAQGFQRGENGGTINAGPSRIRDRGNIRNGR